MTASAPEDEIRRIEAGQNPTRFARGWHCLGLVNEFTDGKPHQVKAFGTQLVVFADGDGKPAVLDAYCRHMGGNLAMGEIKDGSIACPFHDWRWGPDGRCTAIPYAKRIPRKARTAAWPTAVVNDMLFVWNDPEGNPPIADQAIPEIAERNEGEWTDWTWNRIFVEGSNCREIVDNVVDMAHFYYVHYAFPRYFRNIFEGHEAWQWMDSTGRPDVNVGTSYGEAESKLFSKAAYFGPSFMITWLESQVSFGSIHTALINCHYPVTSDSFVLQYGVSTQLLPGMDRGQATQLARKFGAGVEVGFLQDVEIWRHKSRIDNPLLTEQDGPVYQLRRWYEQFYVDVADVRPDMTDRFEFELDTSHAVSTWEAEAAENLSRQGGQPLNLDEPDVEHAEGVQRV